ncbi:MAG TPA: ATP-binding protein [Gallionella sp.]|nr:ATP-binding protein [Gallionella sp.]
MTAVEAIIASAPDDLARARQLVADLAAAENLPAEAVFDLNVILDEVLSNITKYGYDDNRRHEIRLRMAVADGVLEVEIEDDARPFNPLTLPAPDLSLPLAERPVGGLGWHFVRSLVNEAEYARVANHNRLILRKSLNR